MLPSPMKIASFHPPLRTLMGPGPSEMHPRTIAALGQPVIGYLDPIFVGMMDELKELLRYAYQTKNLLTFPVSGPGSVGMETCFVNLVEPGDKVIVPAPLTSEGADKRMNEGLETKDWWLSFKSV